MIKPFGTGCWVTNCDGMDIHLPENKKIISDIASDAKRIRGDIISQALDVEFFLNEVIELFFMGDDNKRTDAFNECILQKEFFTFAEKLRVIKYLLKTYPEMFRLSSDEKKNLKVIQAVDRVMRYRNKITHEHLMVNFNEKSAYILDKKGNNLLSSNLIKEFYRDISYISVAHLGLYVNLITETVKEKRTQTLTKKNHSR